MDGRGHTGCALHQRQNSGLPSELCRGSCEAVFRRPQWNDLWVAVDQEQVRWENWPRAGTECLQHLPSQPRCRFLGACQREYDRCNTNKRRSTCKWPKSVFDHYQHVWDINCKYHAEAFFRIPTHVGSELDSAVGDPGGMAGFVTLPNENLPWNLQPGASWPWKSRHPHLWENDCIERTA